MFWIPLALQRLPSDSLAHSRHSVNIYEMNECMRPSCCPVLIMSGEGENTKERLAMWGREPFGLVQRPTYMKATRRAGQRHCLIHGSRGPEHNGPVGCARDGGSAPGQWAAMRGTR